jgi:hypothetical protein
MYDEWLIVQAFVITTVIVGSLTVYTLQSTRDFKWTGAILFSLLSASLMGGLANVNLFLLFNFFINFEYKNLFFLFKQTKRKQKVIFSKSTLRHGSVRPRRLHLFNIYHL